MTRDPSPTAPDDDGADFLPLSDFARQTGRSYAVLHRLVQSGRIPAQRHGGRWCIARADLPTAHAALLSRLRLSDAAALIGTRYNILHELAQRGRIPAHNHGGRWSIAAADIDAVRAAIEQRAAVNRAFVAAQRSLTADPDAALVAVEALRDALRAEAPARGVRGFTALDSRLRRILAELLPSDDPSAALATVEALRGILRAEAPGHGARREMRLRGLDARLRSLLADAPPETADRLAAALDGTLPGLGDGDDGR